MARRQRVPRHKEHRRKRNKNPKLSPFQREQQRARLANQAPIASIKGSKRDYPISQRAVMEYLMAKNERKEEKRRNRKESAEQEAVAEAAQTTTTTSSSSSSLSVSLPVDPCCRKDTKQKRAKKNKSEVVVKSKLKGKINAKKAKKSAAPDVRSLNDEFSATLSKPVMLFRSKPDSNAVDSVERSTTEEIIARKKEKKHRKKVEARRTRVQEQLREAEEELNNMISSHAKKKRRRGDPSDAQTAAFEKKLKQMQKEKAAQDAVAAVSVTKKKSNKKKKLSSETFSDDPTTHHPENRDSTSEERKRITFTEETSAVDESHHVMRFPNDRSGSKRPRDFSELVDVVRFGDRVEAPPVFDALPRHDTSITRLASRLESSERPERHRLLSSVGGLGEKKRLERLGLVERAAGQTTTTRSATLQNMTKEEEMQRLRERVMESYRRNRRVGFEARKGVDMHHTFPLFS